MSFARIALVQSQGTTDFSDLEGDLDAVDTPAAPQKGFLEYSVEAAHKSPASTMPCPRCRATGQAFGGVCYRCNGSKVVRALSSDPKNVQARERAVERKVEEKTELLERMKKFAAEHADVLAYCGRVKNEFTENCLRQYANEGTMSVGRMAAIANSLERAAAAKVERAVSAPNVAGAGFTKLLDGFKAAAATRLKRPKMTCGDFVFKLATERSNNPGYVYVYRGDVYKGKIAPDGKFFATRETTAEETAAIEKVGRDPFAAAVEHGKLTGQCSICSRKLTDPKSVAAGIGPKCAQGFGW